jgi:hypothetical protein
VLLRGGVDVAAGVEQQLSNVSVLGAFSLRPVKPRDTQHALHRLDAVRESASATRRGSTRVATEHDNNARQGHRGGAKCESQFLLK